MNFSPEFQKFFSQRGLQMKIIWGALTSSILIYIGLSYVLTVINKIELNGVPVTVHYVFYVMALVTSFCSFVFLQFRMSPRRLHELFVRAQQRQEKAENIDGSVSQMPEIDKMSDLERQWLVVIQDVFVTQIICLAINESVVIMGFLVAIMQQRFAAIFVFAILGLALNLRAFPNLTQVIDSANSQRR